MPRYRDIQNSFVAGELSPKLFARTNTTQYSEGAKELTNFKVFPQGGIGRRKGTEYLGRFADDTQRGKIFPFTVANTDPSFSEDYLLIVTQGGVSVFNPNTGLSTTPTSRSPLSGTVPTGLTHGTPFFNLTEDQIHEVQMTQTGDLLWLTHASDYPLLLSKTGPGTFDIGEWWNNPTQSSSRYEERFPYLEQPVIADLTASGTTGLITITSSASYFDPAMIGVPFAFVDSGSLGFAVMVGYTSPTSAGFQVSLTLPGTAFGPSTASTTWFESAWSDFRGWPRTCTLFQQRLLMGGNEFNPDALWNTETADVYQFSLATKLASGAALSATDPFSILVTGGEFNQIQSLNTGRNSVSVNTTEREFIVGVANPDSGYAPDNVAISPETKTGSTYVQSNRLNNTWVFVNRSGRKVYEFVFNRDEDSFTVEELTLIGEHIPYKSHQEFLDDARPKTQQLIYQEARDKILWATDSNGGLFAITRDRRSGVAGWHRHKIAGLSGKKRLISSAQTPGTRHLITFASPHNFLNGDTVKISNYDGATTTVNGVHTVEVVSDVAIQINIDSTSDTPSNNVNVTSDDNNLAPKILSVASLPSRADRDHDDLYLLVERKIDGINRISLERMSKDYFDDGLFNDETDIEDKPVYSDAAVLRGVDVYAGFGSSTDPDISRGNVATDTGAVITGGYLDTTGSSAANWQLQFSQTPNSFRYKGSARLIHQPNYNGAPSGADNIILAFGTNGAGANFELRHTQFGLLELDIYDDAGTLVGGTQSLGSWTPASGTDYIFELNYDLFAGVQRLFIDGALQGSGTATFTFRTNTRDRNISVLNLGGDTVAGGSSPTGTGGNTGQFGLYKQFQMFDYVRHDAAYTEDADNAHLWITALEHLEGDTVQVSANGIDLGDFTVTDGKIVLEDVYQDVIVGLGYESRLVMLTPEVGSAIGSSQVAINRVDRVALRLEKSAYAKVENDEGDSEIIQFREDTVPADQAIPLFTGDKLIDHLASYDRKQEIIVTCDRPLPLNISGIIARGVVND